MSVNPRPVEFFARQLALRLASPPLVTPELEQALTATWTRCKLAWPDVPMTLAQFLPHLAAKLDERACDAAGVAGALREWEHVGDLYLAYACAKGGAEALEAFDTHFISGLGAIAQRFGNAGIAIDEIQQGVRERLFVGNGSRPPGVLEYSGRAPLSSWVFVVASRVALNLVRASKKPLAEGDEKILGLPAPDANQELAYLKKLYKREFSDALTQAMATLPARDKTLLRQHYVDGVTQKQLASVYGVHRVTLVHWVERARDALQERTHHLLLQRLGITPRTLDSITRLVQSQFGASLERILQGDDEAGSQRGSGPGCD
jgi:RNA polymerase sigma-70 factor (ECF subfamily)